MKFRSLRTSHVPYKKAHRDKLLPDASIKYTLFLISPHPVADTETASVFILYKAIWSKRFKKPAFIFSLPLTMATPVDNYCRECD